MKDEHGMPLPPEHIPLPLWIDREQFVDTVRDKNDEEVNLWDMSEFFVHSANHIVSCRDIVRRLATSKSVQELLAIASDAESLWSKMQREEGGGDDN